MAGERLVAMIESSELVARIRVLAERVGADTLLLARYRELLKLQKRLVNLEAKGETTRAAALRKAYETALLGLSDVPAVAEYLALVDELDDIAQEAAAILNEGLARRT